MYLTFHNFILNLFILLALGRLKALNKVDESKDVKFAFYYENNVLKKKWESKDGYKKGNQIVLPKPFYIFALKLELSPPLLYLEAGTPLGTLNLLQ
jgi:hypothetical protein